MFGGWAIITSSKLFINHKILHCYANFLSHMIQEYIIAMITVRNQVSTGAALTSTIHSCEIF